ncbi:hypothetical protein XENOCAPTIV_006445 [Xenoophorus captivus]|uniref:BED-type domain-containing protein n=1 Tax=Xenoophorus captivus TaxID=1517983 RepID=A0ABV0RFX6_9TELE
MMSVAAGINKTSMADRKCSKVWFHFSKCGADYVRCNICDAMCKACSRNTSNLRKHLQHFPYYYSRGAPRQPDSPSLNGKSRSTQISPSVSCPGPDMQLKSSHHRIKVFDLAWLSEVKLSPWIYKNELGN